MPYHDILDFYYSGHMATAAVVIYTFFTLVRRHPTIFLFKFMLLLWLLFKVAYIWLYMTTLRTHYIIDFTSGFCFGVLATIIAEILSYFFDVKVMGRRAADRGLVWFKSCPRCGWSTERPSRLIDDREKKAQAEVAGIVWRGYARVASSSEIIDCKKKD